MIQNVFSCYNNKIQRFRIIINIFFVILSIWAGIEFYYFLKTLYLENPYPRPAGVEAYLPISSLMNLRYFINTGEIHMAHPAGLLFLIGVFIISFIFPKSFCGWVCPFGFLSEVLVILRRFIFKKDFKIPKILDYIMRSFKYLILIFFVYIIFFAMDILSLKEFLDSDYNKIADIKMFYFFANISRTALFIIVILFILSFIFNFFWCRYLCPYGAMLFIISLLSPFRIKRNKKTCINCSKCSLNCPHNIEVDKKNQVFSDDCSFCLLCVSSCPINNTLDIRSIYGKKKINPFYVGVFIILVFSFIKFFGLKKNLWNNNISIDEYRILYQNKEKLEHPGSY
jgi:polyferredoxin